MNEGIPALGVGFEIDFNNSFGQLKSLDDVIGAGAANAVRQFEKVEAASRGAVNLTGASAQITSFSNSLSTLDRSNARVEKSGEAMVRQLTRQIETFGKTASEIRDMRAELRAVEADSRGMTELATRLRTANDEIRRLEQGTGRLPGPSNAARAATQNLGFQIQDFAVQIVGGTSAMRAFAMQAPQAAGALGGFEGKLGNVGKFLNGPWGIAITLGITLLAGFADKVIGTGNAIDDAVDKLKEQAKQTDITRQAQERFQSSAEGVAAAIRDGTQASKEWLKTLDSAAERANIVAKANLAKELTVRRNTLAEIEHAKVLAENARGSWIGANGPNGAQSVVANQYAVEVDRLNATLKAQEAAIDAAEKRVNVTRIDLAAEQAAARAADATSKLTKKYDDQAEAAKRAAYARAEAGETVGKTLFNELIAIERNRLAAVKAEEDRQRAAKSTQNEIGRTISLIEARAIAEKAGGHVTSAERSYDKQQELYDKYVAYKNGGPWAALAAKPGTSNHEKGLALDVAKTDGMTLKKLVAAYRAAGVKLTEALDEGSHFHIAWAAGKAVTEASKEADKIADWLEAQRLKAQGSVWALTQEVDKRSAEWGKGSVTVGDKMLQDDRDAAALKQAGIDNARDALAAYMHDLDAVSAQVDRVAANMRDAFGSVGGAIGGVITVLDEYGKHQKEIAERRALGLLSVEEEAKLQKRATLDQIGFFGDLTASAKGFFKEGSDGYKALETAEKAFRAVEFALSVRAMAQDAIETVTSIANSGARTATKAVEAVVSAISSLPFPLNLVAGAATIAALASIGVAVAGSFGGSKNTLEKANDGTGTVLGDSSAKSDSIKRAIDSLKEVDTLMLGTSRDMLTSLRSIDSQIGGFASLLVRSGDINASGGVNTGFKANAIGSILGSVPLVGGILKGLFGTKTKVIGSGLYGGAQSLEDILGGGFDASYYSDVEKKKKFFGLTTSKKYSTQFASADQGLENQFTLILRQFNDAIIAAAGPLGAATQDIQNRLNGFVVNIGKIDLQGLTGEEIEEKLTAVFGAAADDMAKAAFPGIERFQAVGEGLFETLVRVASTVESVTSSLTMLGSSASLMSVDMKVALAAQFDSVSDFTSAVDSYFETYYTKAEQAAARTAQFADVFDSMGLTMPSTLAAFRSLVEAQDLTTAAGQATYATLLQLAPAFADLQAFMNGAKSAADILSERQDLERKLLEQQGDTAAIRALDLAQLDESNRALQQQIWALQDAKEAADAAQQLKDAWTSVGDSIMDEVNRIRGISDGSGTGSFATLMGQFNAAASAAKAGDQDAASSLPGMSQALLQAAQLAATSRQELDRVKAQTAATLESVYAAIMSANGSGTGVATGVGAPTGTILSAAATAAQVSTGSVEANDNMAAEIKALREEIAGMRAENNAGHAATAGNTGAVKRTLDNVTAASGGEAISIAAAAA